MDSVHHDTSIIWGADEPIPIMAIGSTPSAETLLSGMFVPLTELPWSEWASDEWPFLRGLVFPDTVPGDETCEPW